MRKSLPCGSVFRIEDSSVLKTLPYEVFSVWKHLPYEILQVVSEIKVKLRGQRSGSRASDIEPN